MPKAPPSLRPLPETRHAAELKRLAQNDPGPKPPGWRLSPRSVRKFICGDPDLKISPKFVGDDVLVERAIVTLAGARGLMLVGEPGTAKSMLSELLSAAISGTSTLTIQGTAGTTEDAIRYGWNYALLLAEGPTPRAMVPAPLYTALKEGRLVRFEEITRCPPEIQDALVSVLSDKVMIVPEFDGDDRVVLAQPGFNVIATANLRDRGVHEMSSALKRRFNYETVEPIRDRRVELKLVRQQVAEQLAAAGLELKKNALTTGPGRDALELLVTVFRELRHGQVEADDAEGRPDEGLPTEPIEKPAAVMSTAEAVAVAQSAALDAHYFQDTGLTPAAIARHLKTAVLKDDPDDAKRLTRYVKTVARRRAEDKRPGWSDFHDAT